jgi:hypothetical protein
MATWHAYAKLRQHTEYTLRSFEAKTTDLGNQLRHFSQVTCPAFKTKELPGEATARGRRRVANKKTRALSGRCTPVSGKHTSSGKCAPSGKHTSSSKHAPNDKQPVRETQDQDDPGRPTKSFNLQTSKVHALGDYPSTIRWFGTTDSYSMQRVCETDPGQTNLMLFFSPNLNTIG